MRLKIYFLVVLSGFFLSSCGNQTVDTTPPEMGVVEFIPVPIEDEICGSLDANVFVLEGGDSLLFDVIFIDDEALSQYKIDIHNNFDCHGHGGGSAPSVVTPNVENVTTDWSVLQIVNITGTSTPVVEVLKTPENVTAGNYHFSIQVLDESGNDNPFANFFSLKVTNPLDNIIPEIQIENPSSNSFSVKKGESISFSGKVTDNRSLSGGGNGILYLAYTDLSSGNTFTTDQVFVFDENVDTQYDFDFEYTIPVTLVAGNYRFSLGANDGVRNVAPFVFFEVDVKN